MITLIRTYSSSACRTSPIEKLKMFTIPAVRAISALFISLSLFTSSLVCADQAGYITPTSGTASTTQFDIGPEFAGGTSCGATAFPKGLRTNGAPGGGPGFLYAAVNQLHFGANPAGKRSALSAFQQFNDTSSIADLNSSPRRRRSRLCLRPLLQAYSARPPRKPTRSQRAHIHDRRRMSGSRRG